MPFAQAKRSRAAVQGPRHGRPRQAWALHPPQGFSSSDQENLCPLSQAPPPPPPPPPPPSPPPHRERLHRLEPHRASRAHEPNRALKGAGPGGPGAVPRPANLALAALAPEGPLSRRPRRFWRPADRPCWSRAGRRLRRPSPRRTARCNRPPPRKCSAAGSPGLLLPPGALPTPRFRYVDRISAGPAVGFARI
jgi:hypothetical protein